MGVWRGRRERDLREGSDCLLEEQIRCRDSGGRERREKRGVIEDKRHRRGYLPLDMPGTRKGCHCLRLYFLSISHVSCSLSLIHVAPASPVARSRSRHPGSHLLSFHVAYNDCGLPLFHLNPLLKLNMRLAHTGEEG